MSLSQPHPAGVGAPGKAGLALSAAGAFLLLAAWAGWNGISAGWLSALAFISIFSGTAIYAVRLYRSPGSIRNNGVWHVSLTNRGAVGWFLGIFLTGFYIILYWFPEWLGWKEHGQNSGLVAVFDPLSVALNGRPASRWFMYGTLYTLLILALGVKFALKYRHSRHQLLRTLSVATAQLFLAYLVPEMMADLHAPEAYFAKDIKFFWPLNHYFFENWHLDNMRSAGIPGMVFMVWGIFGFTVLTPVVTWFAGKRWYCSWVCGCGGLAETAGDPFRQLSSKKLSAWRLERWLVHGVLILIVAVTAVVLYGYFSGSATFLGLDINEWFRKPYGFFIGAIFSGVIGVGFYPILGNRVWCRFGCPLAAYMGMIQRFWSRFRITVNGGQCISCGNCSTYCEQGIDVRWYAQRGQDVVRSSCVGCGICSEVCPRGVLKLENGPVQTRRLEPADS